MNNQGESFNRRAQVFFHKWDWYANPVTLTYNQKKSFTTVPGAICSIISGILLIYYVLANVIFFWRGENWSQSEISSSLDYANPPAYLID